MRTRFLKWFEWGSRKVHIRPSSCTWDSFIFRNLLALLRGKNCFEEALWPKLISINRSWTLRPVWKYVHCRVDVTDAPYGHYGRVFENELLKFRENAGLIVWRQDKIFNICNENRQPENQMKTCADELSGFEAGENEPLWLLYYLPASKCQLQG